MFKLDLPGQDGGDRRMVDVVDTESQETAAHCPRYLAEHIDDGSFYRVPFGLPKDAKKGDSGVQESPGKLTSVGNAHQHGK